MRGVQALWHGSLAETTDLLRAIDGNCDCKRGIAGELLASCGAHQLLGDQRQLDGLLFVRSLRERLEVEEHGRRTARARG